MTTASHHLIFGAGLIGGFVAGGLMSAGFATSVVARDKTREEMSGGLTLTDYLGNKEILPAPNFAGSDAGSELDIDILWLTVKCTAVASSLDEIANFVNPNTIIVCCQNGLGSERPVQERFPENTVLGAVVGYNVAAPAPGALHRSTEGKLVVQQHPKLVPIVQQLNRPLFPTSMSRDFVADQWAKLQLNLANPVGALADIPVKAMLEQYDYRKIIVALQHELLAVTKAMQIDLPKLTVLPPTWIPKMLGLPDFLFARLGQKMLAIDPTARLSMWWDLHNGKRTEIDFLNNAVVAAAHEHGLEAPINKRIVALIKQAEAGEITIGFSGSQLRQALEV